jgi:uncharacterized membrane protein
MSSPPSPPDSSQPGSGTPNPGSHGPAAAGARRTVLSTRRLEAYTDGVFAIAATLLVLNLSVEAFSAVHSSAEFARELVDLAPSLLNVVISFLLLSTFWLVHVRQFEYIPRVDTAIVWLNTIRLLGVVLVPFSTSLNDEFDQYLIARTLLPLNFVMIVAMSTWQWFHATAPHRQLVQGVSAQAVHNGRVNAVSALIQAICVVPLAAMVGPVAFLLFALDPVIARVLRRVGVMRPPPDGVVVD